jgi:hypothetical protein
MSKSPNRFTRQTRSKLYTLAFGLSAGIGAQVLTNSCVTSGQ